MAEDATTRDTLSEVTTEVGELHTFLVRWYSGSVEADDGDLQESFADRLADDFQLITPSGKTIQHKRLVEKIRAGHGKNPDFRIKIRNIVVTHDLGETVLATYEEWQRLSSDNSHVNARVASVAFARGDEGLLWLHVQETSLPDTAIAAGPTDF